jgi:FAD/FMN-containing dehydrogenase
VVTALAPFSAGGRYLNFAGFQEEGEAMMRAAFGARKHERLAALKRKFDPGNLFRLNPNIAPTPEV